MPLLLVHGFASGSALWCKNIDALAKSRAVYVFDLLGFGRSSRPDFILDDIEVEDYLIQSIEEWRQAMKLERFILLGHSLGGYLSTSYALRHADKIEYLILVEPWGFAEYPLKQRLTASAGPVRSFLFRTVSSILKRTNPFSLLRAAGPFGKGLVRCFRNDLYIAFRQSPSDPNLFADNHHDDSSSSDGNALASTDSDHCPAVTASNSNESDQKKKGRVDASPSTLDESPHPRRRTHPCRCLRRTRSEASLQQQPSSSISLPSSQAGQYDHDDKFWTGSSAIDYIYHLNVQKPSGETAFRALCTSYGHPKAPMIDRIDGLDARIDIAFIYGAQSWIDDSPASIIRDRRDSQSHVSIHYIENATHQVYAQQSQEFNRLVIDLIERIDVKVVAAAAANLASADQTGDIVDNGCQGPNNESTTANNDVSFF